MFVVDLHALQTIDFLDLVDEVFLHGIHTRNSENIVRVNRTFAEPFTGVNAIAFVDVDMASVRNQVILGFTFIAMNIYLLLTADDLAELDNTVDFGNNRRIVRFASLEQLGYSGQTTGDVTRFRYIARNLDQESPRLNCIAIADKQLSTGRDTITGQFLLLRIHHNNGREQGLISFLNDNGLDQTGCLIEFFAKSNIRDNIFVSNLTAVFGDDCGRVRIPFENGGTFFDFITVVDSHD